MLEGIHSLLCLFLIVDSVNSEDLETTKQKLRCFQRFHFYSNCFGSHSFTSEHVRVNWPSQYASAISVVHFMLAYGGPLEELFPPLILKLVINPLFFYHHS